MGFLSSTTSFTRLTFLEDISSETKNNIQELLSKYAFEDIDHIAQERAWGWTSFDDMLDTKWERTVIDKAEFVCFSLRLDTRRIPAAVLKKHTRLAIMREEQIIKDTQGKNYIPKERRTEIREKVKLDLMTRTLPIPAEFQAVWDIENKIIYFGSVQQKIVDLFVQHFTLTFDAAIEPLTPYSLALNLLGEEASKDLDAINVSTFV